MDSFSKDDRKRKHDTARAVSPPPVKRKVQSTTTTVASFFTPSSQKPPEKITWTTLNNSLIIGHYSPNYGEDERHRNSKRRKIAAFDLDSTLIKTVSGKKFADGSTDWTWWDLSVPQILKQLDKDGYRVVIVSNQGGIALSKDSNTVKSDQKRFTDFKTKLCAILVQLDIPISVYGATQRDHHRKPRTGIWREMLEHYDLDDELGPDLGASFFVGDAGGRSAEAGSSNKDFSSSDRDFASNVGVKFMTPEEFFLKQDARSFVRTFEPSGYVETETDTPPFTRAAAQDIVVFCGSPGAGKSTYYLNILKPLGYERVNQDTLNSRNNCVKVAGEFLMQGKSVAIDNTNADAETRQVWLDLAQRFRIPARCVVFKADSTLCRHNEAVRALNPEMNPEGRTMLPAIAFASFAKRYREPTLEEGFVEIIGVEFRFRGTPEQKQIWSRYHI